MLRPLALCALVFCACPSAAPPLAPRHLQLFAAPPGDDVAALVTEQQARSRAAGRTLLVYVGATWCEPCERFKHAAQAGELDRDFGDVDLVTFDADMDSARLERAGYGSRMIPLLALPGPAGRGTDQRIEGSVKGEGAVANLTPRLKALLGR